MRIYEDTLSRYLHALLPDEEAQIAAFRMICEKDGIPVLEPETLQLLETILAMTGAKKILEIGTGEGFSACAMAGFIGEEARVLTVEKDAARARKARENIARYGFSTRVFCEEGEAQSLLKTLNQKGKAAPFAVLPPYDLVFLDGPKAHYGRMLETIKPLLREEGVLVADNVLFRGLVAEKIPAKHRKITIVKRLRRFLERIEKDPDLTSVILPVAEGVSISVKRMPSGGKLSPYLINRKGHFFGKTEKT